MTTLHDFPTIPQYGSLPIPAGVEVVGIDVPIGRLTAYRTVPDEPSKGTVLIVPGYTGSKEDWRTFLPHLQARGWTAIVISRRGQADSAAPTDPADYRLEAEANDVVEVARQLDNGAPVHLIGHSLGGVIARAAAIQQPDAFRSITMFCSGPRGWRNRKYVERHLVVEEGKRALFDANNPLWAGRPDSELDANIRFLRDRWDRTSTLSILGGAEILEDETDTTDDLKATGLPCLVSHGIWDGAWPIPWQRQMAARLDAKYKVIPHSYHGPQVENPYPTAATFDEFLAEH